MHTLLGFIFGHNAPSLALFRKFGFSVWGELLRVAVLDGEGRQVRAAGLPERCIAIREDQLRRIAGGHRGATQRSFDVLKD